jgi:hypothetical protein
MMSICLSGAPSKFAFRLSICLSGTSIWLAFCCLSVCKECSFRFGLPQSIYLSGTIPVYFSAVHLFVRNVFQVSFLAAHLSVKKVTLYLVCFCPSVCRECYLGWPFDLHLSIRNVPSNLVCLCPSVCQKRLSS